MSQVDEFLPPPSVSAPAPGRPGPLVTLQSEPEALFGSPAADRWLDQHQPLAAGLVLGVVLAASVLLARNWRLQRTALRRAQEASRARSELDSVLGSLPDPLLELDPEGRVLRRFGLRSATLAVFKEGAEGQTFEQLLPPAAAQGCREALREAEQKGRALGQQIALPARVGSSWFELSVAKLGSQRSGPGRYLLSLRDITTTVEATSRIQRHARLYEILRRCNRAIVTSGNRQEMFERVCSLAVASREVKMGWIGLLDPASGDLHPVARAGHGTSYVDRLQLSVRADHPGGQGPTGTALRDDRPFWCADFQHDPLTAPWQEIGREFGWTASASLPLHVRGRVIGGLTLYFGSTLFADEESRKLWDEIAGQESSGDGVKLITKGFANEGAAFDRQTQKLLLDLAHDVDIALERFAREQETEALEEKLRASESLYRQLTESISDVIWSLDPHSFRFLYVSPSVLRQRGLPFQEVLEAPIEQAFLPDSLQVLRREVNQIEQAFATGGGLAPGGARPLELQQPHAGGGLVHTEVILTPVVNERSGLLEVHGLSRDITERKLAEERISYLVSTDLLTGLPNRDQLELRIKDELLLAQRHGTSVALLCLDLDNFRAINEAYGFAVGDRLLIETAQRIRGGLRRSDLLARFADDTFMVLLADTNPAGALHVARGLLERMDPPLMVKGHAIRITASVGVSTYPVDGPDVVSLMRKAEASVRSAKRTGISAIRVYSEELLSCSERSLELSFALHDAITREQLALHYQPQVDLRTGSLVGAEVLLRWNHHRLGAISPGEFIPIAESRGLIRMIGDWVLQQALQRMRLWLDQGRAPLVVAVNLSALQFRNPTLVEDIARLLDQQRLPPSCLELELTESVTMDDPEAAVRTLARLSALGIRISIDDFGTGYSSFSYLSRLRVNKLKIDQSFVRDLEESEDGRVIVRSIIELAHSLSIATIAEGVETPGQLAFLRDHGCDEIQGYLFSRPLAVDEFEGFLEAPPVLPEVAHP